MLDSTTRSFLVFLVSLAGLGCGKLSGLFLREGEARRSKREQHVNAGEYVETLGLPHEVEEEYTQQEEDRKCCTDCDGIVVAVSVGHYSDTTDQAFCQEKNTACQNYSIHDTAYYAGDIVSSSSVIYTFEEKTANLFSRVLLRTYPDRLECGL